MQLVGHQVTVSRGGHEVLSRLDFAVAAGSSLVLTGPNGSGKTTLLRAIAGLTRLEAGRIALATADDAELQDDETEPIGERCHFVGHLPAINGRLTLQENLAFWQRYLGDAGEVEDMVTTAALDRVGLGTLGDLPADVLSAGQRRRLALARLFVAKRPLWLLDEPTTALDANSADRLIEAINAHTASGGIAVVATHQPLALDRVSGLELGL